MKVSFVIPAFNEEKFIEKTILAIQTASQNNKIECEIIVVDNNSTDDTAQVASNLGAIVVNESKQQIARARNTGASHATHSYLIFIDADTEVNTTLLQQTIQCFESDQCIAGGTTITTDHPSKNLNRYVMLWNKVSSKLKLAAGCYIFCTKTAFNQVGGFNEKIYASEEIWLFKRFHKLAKKEKKSITILQNTPITTSARKFDWFSPNLLILQILLFFFFPFLCRYKMFCFMWYIRPKKSE